MSYTGGEREREREREKERREGGRERGREGSLCDVTHGFSPNLTVTWRCFHFSRRVERGCGRNTFHP